MKNPKLSHTGSADNLKLFSLTPLQAQGNDSLTFGF